MGERSTPLTRLPGSERATVRKFRTNRVRHDGCTHRRVRLLPCFLVPALAAVTALFLPGAAHAQHDDNSSAPVFRLEQDDDSPPKSRARVDRWYGYQTLLFDGAALVMMGAGVSRAPVFLAGAAGYAVGPPLVHIANGSAGGAAASFGVRVLTPILGAIGGWGVGHATCRDDSSTDCGSLVAGLGFVSGMAVATTLDATMFAYERADKPKPMPDEPPATIHTSLRVTPRVERDLRGAILAASGTF